jgi:hypothetical protein
MPVRIYDISKKLGIEVKVILAKAKEMGIFAAKVPSSSLDKITAECLEEELVKSISAAFQRGFRGLSLGNFKAFAETQNVPIKPLTLIFGANSSGKSSIIHALLLACHAAKTKKLDVTHPDIGGKAVDLGGFRQFVHKRDVGRKVEWSVELDVQSINRPAYQMLNKHKRIRISLTFGMPQDDHGNPMQGKSPWLISYIIDSDGQEIIRMSRRGDGTMRVDRVESGILVQLIQGVILNNTTASTQPSEAELKDIKKSVDDMVSEMRFAAPGLLPEKLLGEYSSGYFYPIPKSNRLEALIRSAGMFIPKNLSDLVLGVNGSLEKHLDRVRYLGPLRSFPRRHLAFGDDHDANWLAGGGYAWDVVRTNAKVRESVNGWLGADALQTKYQLKIRPLTPLDELEKRLADAIESLPIEQISEGVQPATDGAGHEYDGEPPGFGIKDPQREATDILKNIQANVGEQYDELVLMDMRSGTAVTHRDVGIGVSQVLPVLVHAYADEAQIIAIEQPEIHLHPALQAELGDLFIESALGQRKNTFLLETHSEHLILRIMRRIRETHLNTLPKGKTPVTSNDVSILFVEPDGTRSIVRQMPLNVIGELVKAWPGGFFEEGLKEVLPS